MLVWHKFILVLYQKNFRENREHYDKQKIQHGKKFNVFSGASGIVRGVFSECNKACERRDESSGSTYIYSHKQGAVIPGKMREQHRGGNIAYDLAGQNRKNQSIFIEYKWHEISDRVYARHISREDEKAYKCEQKGIVHLTERFPIGKNQYCRN